MSIIHDALKKAAREKKDVSLPSRSEGLAKNLDIEFEKKKEGINWGPVFVLLVLLLITAPIIAPIFSTPFKRERYRTIPPGGAVANGLAQAPSPQVPLVKTPETTPMTRKGQFAIEEAPRSGPALGAVVSQPLVPPLSLSGIMYSPEGKSYCIINGSVLKVGEHIHGARILQVTPSQVVLDYRGEKIVLYA